MTMSVAAEIVNNLRFRRVRTFGEFAEQEIILPSGPRRGRPFSLDFMAFAREVLGEFSKGNYSEFYGSGPVQSGKTTIFYVIPALYHLFEMEEDIILGAPVLEMAQSSYRERLLPAIQRSRYKRLIPRGGFGAHGRAMSIRFLNGASLRFMGAHGGDEQISSYTARVVIATELDKMDVPGEASRESDPVTKLKARSKSFGSSARFYGECTMSVKQGRIFREVVQLGTDSRVFLQCQYCQDWVYPERESFVGWQDAVDVIEAKVKAGFQCPGCTKLWTEIDRQRAIRNPRIVARDQTVTREGLVEGKLPNTLTYGFRWNAMASPLLKMSDIAKEEWDAGQLGTTAAEKGVYQHIWAEPWEAELADLTRPTDNTVLGKIIGHQRGQIPPETVKVTLGIDVGSYVIWWTLWAWDKEARGHLVDFGGIDVPVQVHMGERQKNPLAVLAALRTFKENIIAPGWGGRRPDMTLIDSGYEQDVVYQFVRESGQPRYLACKGFGTVSRHGQWRDLPAAKPSETREIGMGYFATLQPHGVNLVHVDADHFKATVHDGFWAAQGAPGSLTVFHGEKQDPELRRFARQIVAEQRIYKATEGKEQRVVWQVTNRQNHYLDASAYARCAAEILGVRLTVLPRPPKAKTRPIIQGGIKWSRDRY